MQTGTKKTYFSTKTTTWIASALVLLLLFLIPTEGIAQLEDQADVGEITGTVVNEEGDAIAGARVLYQKGTKSVITDDEGTFSLTTVSSDVLVIKAQEYERRYVKLQEANLAQPIELISRPAGMGEDALVNLPYRNLPSRMTTSAYSQVTGGELNSYPTLNVANALAGKAPGLHVVQDYGRPGWAEPSLYLRGLHSSSGNQPVVFIDGIEREIIDLGSREIESVHLLKDVSSKLLVGPKAMNGVLWIETKRGTPYERQIDIHVEHGTSMPTALPDYMGSHDYARLYNEARENDGMKPFYSESDLEGYQQYTDSILYPENDLYGDFLQKSMPFTRISSQMAGGDEQTQYFVNLSYMHSGGLENIGPTTNYDKFKARANLDVALTDVTTLHLDINGRLEFREWNNMSPWEFFNMLSDHRPNEYPYFINEFESLDSARFGASYQYHDNIYGEATRTGYRKDLNRMGQVNLGLDFDLNQYLEGMSAEAYMMFDSYNYLRYNKSGDYNAYIPYTVDDSLALQQVSQQQDLSSQSHHADDVYRRLGGYVKATYEKTFGRVHRFHGDLLGRYYQTVLKNVDQDSKNSVIGLSTNYMYDNKYLLEASLALYGTPRLREGNRYGLFPAFGAGWILSEEAFLSEANFIDFLKVKVSWGKMGTTNNFPSYFSYRDVWSRGGSYNFGYTNGNSNQQVQYGTPASPGLSWETSREMNAGVAGLLFSKRLRLEASYFNELRSGIPVQRTGYYPSLGGNYLPYENYEEVSNQGLEALIRYSGKSGELSYSIGINGAYTRSSYETVNEPAYPHPYMKQEGDPVDAQYGWVDGGLFSDQQAVDEAAEQMFGVVMPGDIRYLDLNDDGVVNGEDQKKIGNWFPEITYGVDLRIGYRGLQLYVSGAGVSGLNSLVNNKYNWVNGEDKYPSYIEDARWTPDQSGSATYPRLTTKEGSNNFRNSSFWIRTRDYFKIKNVELSYSLPEQLISNIAMQEARIFVRGVNVMTFSPMERMDPELPDAGLVNWPLFSTYTGGVKFSF